MKLMLLISLFLMLPFSAMTMETDPHTQRTQANQDRLKKKKIATLLLTGLTLAGCFVNGANIMNNMPVVRYCPSDGNGLVPANTETCSYKMEVCRQFLDYRPIPTEYCDCDQPACQVIIEECSDESQKQTVRISAMAYLAQAFTFSVSFFGIWW